MFGRGFDSRFWGFGRASQAIGDLLSSPDCTLEKLMDEESFLDELRSGNSQLMEL